MQKLFHFDCPREVYTADACVVSCFDARFDLAVRKFLKRRGVAIYDHIKIPGSAKALAGTGPETDRELLLRTLRVSLALHHPARAFLIGHRDCGAYPGLPPEAVVTDLLSAADCLRAAEPALAVECYFADFDGIYALP